MSALFSKLFTQFLSKIAKNAVFALCCELSIAEVKLCFNLVRKCRSAIAELRCTSTESKSLLQNLRCASDIKKIKSVKVVRTGLGNDYQSGKPGTIGVARIFDWGGPNHKSRAMTSSKIFKKGTFCRAKIS